MIRTICSSVNRDLRIFCPPVLVNIKRTESPFKGFGFRGAGHGDACDGFRPKERQDVITFHVFDVGPAMFAQANGIFPLFPHSFETLAANRHIMSNSELGFIIYITGNIGSGMLIGFTGGASDALPVNHEPALVNLAGRIGAAVQSYITISNCKFVFLVVGHQPHLGISVRNL
jgi:hypothetical protein